MNSDTLKGTGRDVGGTIKEAAGNLSGDRSLEGEGLVDQFAGTVQKTYGSARDMIEEGATPLLDEIKRFARDRPFVAAALAGVIGIALINTLRGK